MGAQDHKVNEQLGPVGTLSKKREQNCKNSTRLTHTHTHTQSHPPRKGGDLRKRARVDVCMGAAMQVADAEWAQGYARKKAGTVLTPEGRRAERM